jgi:hypothetical protein
MRNSKVSCGGWFCTSLLVYGGAHQLKHECSYPWLNMTTFGEREIYFLCVHTRTHTCTRSFLRVLTRDLRCVIVCFFTSIPFKSKTVAY